LAKSGDLNTVEPSIVQDTANLVFVFLFDGLASHALALHTKKSSFPLATNTFRPLAIGATNTAAHSGPKTNFLEGCLAKISLLVFRNRGFGGFSTWNNIFDFRAASNFRE
jgi:hypothetical protein